MDPSHRLRRVAHQGGTVTDGNHAARGGEHRAAVLQDGSARLPHGGAEGQGDRNGGRCQGGGGLR